MKKLLSVLIVACLIAGLLPVFASAAGVATVSIVSDAAAGTMTDYTLSEGDTVYLKNNEDGAASDAIASDVDYTVKLDYPVGGIPTIYLNGATLKSAKIPLLVKGAAGENEDYIIVVEADSLIESGAGAAIRATYANLTITGEGKLTINAHKGYGIHGYNPNASKLCSQKITYLMIHSNKT